MQFLPTTAGADIVASVLDVVTGNIAPVLVLVGFGMGYKLITRHLSKAGKGRI